MDETGKNRTQSFRIRLRHIINEANGMVNWYSVNTDEEAEIAIQFDISYRFGKVCWMEHHDWLCTAGADDIPDFMWHYLVCNHLDTKRHYLDDYLPPDALCAVESMTWEYLIFKNPYGMIVPDRGHLVGVFTTSGYEFPLGKLGVVLSRLWDVYCKLSVISTYWRKARKSVQSQHQTLRRQPDTFRVCQDAEVLK
jgi:hypothetical protein